MPPSLEQFTQHLVGRNPREVGQIKMEEVCLKKLRSTRPFVTQKRINRSKRRGARKHPEVIRYDGQDFLIDGHHKTKRVCPQQERVDCRVLTTKNERIGKKLRKMDAGPIEEIEIRA